MTKKKQRSDSWTSEMDEALAESVLAYLREGKTMKGAFTTIGDRFNKTEAAVQFRWNSEVKSKYNESVKLAKKQGELFKKEAKKSRKKNKDIAVVATSVEVESPVSVEAISLPSVTVTAQEEVPVHVQEGKTQVASHSETNNSNASKIDFVEMITEHVGQFNSLKAKVQELQQLLLMKETELVETKQQLTALKQQKTDNEESIRLNKENKALKEKNEKLQKELEEFTVLASAIKKLENRKASEDAASA